MDDLISEFIAETSESLELLDSELVQLEQNPNDREILGNIFRLVHTIKGTCGFLGLPRLASVAHAGENVLGKIRDGEIAVTPDAISIVLESLDRIKGLISFLSENGVEPEGDDTELINRLNAFADSNGQSSAAASAATSARSAEQSMAEEEEPIEAEIQAAAPATAAEEAPLEGGGRFAQSELEALERAFAEAESFAVPPVPNEFLVEEDEPAEPAESEAVTAPAAENTIADAPTPAEASSNTPTEPAAHLPATPAPSDATNLDEKVKETAIQQGMDTPVTGTKKDAGGQQSIRVNIDVLENLMQMVGELVLTRNQLLQLTRERDERELTAPLQQLSQITSELQEGIMKTRMQPISIAWSKFPRLIRDLSHELDKKINLQMIGENTEVDRQLLEAIKDPLTHMVRNSCDHGLETPKERIKAGKPETGTVTLSALHEGGYIIIKIADDGRGINLNRVKQKAIENGLTTEDQLIAMSDEQIMQFIFRAGFSTAEKITSVSGRGVGMDVVRTNIEKIGGAVSLTSIPGEGSTFHIKIPLTLAIVSVLIVQVRSQRFAIPQLNVAELVNLGDDSEYQIEMVHGAPILRLREKLVPMVSLAHVLGLQDESVPEPESALNAESTDEKQHYAAIIKVGANEFGVLVDRVHDTEEIVVKPTSRVLENLPIYAGNTILGDGSVIMILDPNSLAKSIDANEAAPKQADGAASRTKERATTYLLFSASDQTQKAVPLELVSRLEEIDAKTVEHTGASPVVQYRNDLMQLRTLDGADIPSDGVLTIIVFSYDGRSVGLVVESILDIVKASTDIRIASENPLYMGGLIITNKATDVLDVAHLIHTSIKTSGGEEKTVDLSGLGEMALLFIEDSPFFRNMTMNYFKSIGLNAVAASSGAEGLKALREAPTPYDVIVTDIEMPEMDGFQFASHARNIERYMHTPIYAFTSTVNQDVLERAKASSMHGVVNKTNRDQLVELLAHQLSSVEAKL